MSINISSLPFTLTINGIDRTANTLSIALSQDEFSDLGLISIRGSITLQANYDQLTAFTYLASPAIAANWARGAQVVYQVSGDPFVLSGARLFILKEPAPPNDNYQITLEIGDEAALKNYRSADQDLSGVAAGVATARNIVIANYLNGADITNSISAIAYPFAFPQPKTDGSSFVEMAGKIARASNQYLYTNQAGTLVNSAIDLNATAIATFTIGNDEKLFEQVDGSGVETPVDELICSALVTSVEPNIYPKVTVTESNIDATFYFYTFSGLRFVSLDLIKIKYINKRVTTTDYGFDGSQERVTIFSESALPVYDRDNANLLLTNPALFLYPSSLKTSINRYDSKSRVVEIREEEDKYLIEYIFNSFLNASVGILASPFARANSRTVRVTKNDYQDIVTTYTYSDTDVIISKREETTNYQFAITADQNVVFGRTAKEETWLNGTYQIQNYYQTATYGNVREGNTYRQTTTLGDWTPSTSENIYSNDGSTAPPKTTYRQPFVPIEKQVVAKVKATPFAGASLRARSRPVEVPYTTDLQQLTEYANTYLALLYGRKQGFIFATNYFSGLKPLARINIIWRGVIYECICDGISWEHNLTESAIAMRLITLRTALAATPLVVNRAVIASPMIEAVISLELNFFCEIVTEQYLGGVISLELNFFCQIISDLAISATISLELNFLATIT